ncbi:MAG: alanine--tRNA ligase [Candidatus Diapherotrites archaeon]|uniref:Alanine--tRNA ligase n=1 Tax=Candidatus Iainarchaeum sp. TaxID=3101447 RepID=A0A938YS75_9ARCH|nr:alanine--tRNA ligase [Candidatus Diapherotrites archaeon]
MWTAKKLAKAYLDFFREKGHAIIPSASLIPEHDPTVLFTTAGMHPLVPFLLGQKHPEGKRLANNQKCLRTDDIDEVGDASHHTFFFMLGNWSLGDYFKKEAIEYSFEFLTSRKWLGLDKKRISVSCFKGDKDSPKDVESAKHWEKAGIPKKRIYFFPKKDNWWGPAGKTGPCGPDTEMFYDTGKKKCGKECKPGCGCGKYFEIWNDVFMQYNKTAEGKFEKLKQQNVDTGMGLERTVAVLQGKGNDYETELFRPMMEKAKELSKSYEEKSARIISDHLRAVVFVIGEGKGIVPSNVEQGYVLRRLIRRSIRHARLLGIEGMFCRQIAKKVIEAYSGEWPELEKNSGLIFRELEAEEEKFGKILGQGVKMFEKILKKEGRISGKDAFLLYQSFGFPLEMTAEIAREKGIKIDRKAFEKEFENHQEISRQASAGKFKSGLADHSEITVRMHTATHLLHAALRKVLGEHVQQKGSNITPERLRFDFSNPEKVTKEQLEKVEKLVNDAIGKGIAVKREEMSLEEARKKGALAFFDSKYVPEKVSVYTIEGVSKEVCAGPHVKNTKAIGKFRIKKEEAISAGVRRIKAVIEQ